jgi:uncharacterized membrane protein
LQPFGLWHAVGWTAEMKIEVSALTVVLLVAISVSAVILAEFTPQSSVFLPMLDEVITTLLTVATDILYLIGGGVVFLGAVLVTVRFLRVKLKSPYQPAGVTRFLSGYLTLSLEFFIGAEIIKTTTTRTWEEFSVLILIILSRGLFSLILYLERRWHGKEGAECE